MKRIAAVALAALAAAACERPVGETAEPVSRPEPVVVYASYDDENYLPSLFADFTRETGIPVTVRHRPEYQVVGEVIANKGSPPADLLLTRSVHGAWRAADEGALRPLQSPQVSRTVPGWLHDPDDYWTAIGFSPVSVVCNADRQADCDAVEAYPDLANPGFEKRLCLSTSSLAVNRTLIAGLIADHGLRPAELIVRGWIANLALPPFDSEAALLQAVEAGSCGVGVVSGVALHGFNRPTVAVTWPQPGYFDVVAVGISRHARSPDSARRLVEWLVGAAAQAAQFDATGQRPVDAGVPAAGLPFPPSDSTRNAAVFGLHETDATGLAERARWQ
jgi:iron(III) transport system substrate-binding protein